MNAFAVFGNPIKHSRSADIYELFAKQINISSKYDLRLVSKDNFNDILLSFFNSEGGLGANITVPFKERAISLCHHLTERAIIANSVNTIKKQHDNTLLGDNTDGIGLLNDLKRLNWVDQSNNIIIDNTDMFYDKNINPIVTNILVIGSGGAAKGIVPALLDITGCHINVVNRTFINAQRLVHYYHRIGRQNISYINLNDLYNKSFKKKYSLVINATSSSMYNEIPKIPSSLITNVIKCYDLFYQKEDTVFIKWCKDHGACYCSDGLGMLVEQAAYSFYLWHSILPSTTLVLNYLKSIF